MTANRPLPGDPAPALTLPLVGGGVFDLANATIDRFLVVDVYRGLHCPRCRLHLMDLAAKLPHFARRGVGAVAVSMDKEDRARTAQATWHLGDLPVAYGLTESMALDWGLFLSRSINEQESSLFAEPATYLIATDRRIYSVIKNSTPFARFHFADLLEGIDTIIARNYPPRGTYNVHAEPGGEV